MRTRVKYCGITRPADAHIAAELGVDALGLVFYPPSPRSVTIEQAREVIAAVPAFVTIVALFVDPEVSEVEAVLTELPIDLLQFHGDESAEQCQRYDWPYIKAVRMQQGVDLPTLSAHHAQSRGLLLDSYQAGVAGGSGQTFDWARVPSGIACPIILAGGLTSDNVATAIEQIQPFAVDVSGGIESAKGIKDSRKMKDFIRSVNTVERRND
ncbi:MAG: phosphoribosylanthranilate isomerase [Gammaproteobacteria bacterium]|nr:phosphoribosylanthranilate isomerase [Gammaproteobacteria bacterium]PCH80725.1 MAG: phosphoribosylanthranilate isomerase [Hyphomicrobiales bacterium]